MQARSEGCSKREATLSWCALAMHVTSITPGTGLYVSELQQRPLDLRETNNDTASRFNSPPPTAIVAAVLTC